MIEELLKLQENSYVPISHFPVSACVVMKDGKKFYGVNVEDASTRAGVCAERNAIYAAVTAGYQKGDFQEVHVMVSSGKIGTPCFVCRQMISELFEQNGLIRCYATTGEYQDFTVEELCPYPFGEDDLQ